MKLLVTSVGLLIVLSWAWHEIAWMHEQTLRKTAD